jgi:hypothetical protein
MSKLYVIGPAKLKEFYDNPRFVRYDQINGGDSIYSKGYTLKGMIGNKKVYYRKSPPKA